MKKLHLIGLCLISSFASPKEVASSDAVKLVSENPAMIGVIKKEDVSDKVKVVHSFSD